MTISEAIVSGTARAISAIKMAQTLPICPSEICLLIMIAVLLVIIFSRCCVENIAYFVAGAFLVKERNVLVLDKALRGRRA